MARRSKTSPAEALIEVLALLPWWAGTTAAMVTYVVLHALAAQKVTAAAVPGHMGAFVLHNLWQTMASVGQYILPLICLLGAAMSAFRRHQRQRLLTNLTRNRANVLIDTLSWREFEMLVGEGFRLQGYRVLETGGAGADGGVDLVLSKGGEKFLVQCKQWRAQKVGVVVARELYGVMAAKGAAGGFVVTSGRFTDEAMRFASGRNLQLVDGPQLVTLIRQAQAAKSSSGRSPAGPAAAGCASPPMPESAGSSPRCPQCRSAMVERTARRGAAAGAAFWGCSGFPGCRGVRPTA